MADTGYQKALYHSRAVRPGDSTTPAPKTTIARPKKAAPVAAMGSASAPHKTELDKFQSKFGFGMTGLTGRT